MPADDYQEELDFEEFATSPTSSTSASPTSSIYSPASSTGASNLSSTSKPFLSEYYYVIEAVVLLFFFILATLAAHHVQKKWGIGLVFRSGQFCIDTRTSRSAHRINNPTNNAPIALRTISPRSNFKQAQSSRNAVPTPATSSFKYVNDLYILYYLSFIYLFHYGIY